MRRRRRQTEIKSQLNIFRNSLKKSIPKKVAESIAQYSMPDIAQEFTKFLQRQPPVTEKKPARKIQWEHAEQILASTEQFYPNFRAPLDIFESFMQYASKTMKQTKTAQTMLSAARGELLNIENILVYLWLVWLPEIPQSETDVHSALQRELSLITGSFRARKISIHTEFTETPHITCSPQLLALCIRNVLANIGESAKTHSELLIKTGIQTGLSQRQPASHLELQFTHPVENDEKVSIDRAFTLFYTTKPSHIGIGLTLCREIMKAMNGAISLKMQPGLTVQTTITLPV